MERLCPVCVECVFGKREWHYETLSEIQASATSCWLCSSIARILKTTNVEPRLFVSKHAGARCAIARFRFRDLLSQRIAIFYARDLPSYGIIAKTVECDTGGFGLDMVCNFLVKHDDKIETGPPDKPLRLGTGIRRALEIKSEDIRITDPTSRALLRSGLFDESGRKYNANLRPVTTLDNLFTRAIWSPDIKREQIIDARLDLIRFWIDQCRNEHPGCQMTQSHQKPTRLLDVLPNDRSDIVKLVEVAKLKNHQDILYTTLSHCWGKDIKTHFVTTKLNEAQRCQSIANASLPKTYHDAVEITRKLGIRYIWIDSLCIIQDDLTDWQQESSRMSTVFEGSYLTIAATSASNAHEGCYLDNLEPPVRVKCGHEREPALIRCPGSDTSALHRSVLNSRAWVLQELVLSPRTIQFTSQQLYWQCREIFLSEDGLFQSEKFASIRAMYETRLFPGMVDRLDLDTVWWTWVRDYSNRKLSKPEDWLAATAGITQHFQNHTGWTPCLGLWRETLVTGLCWHVSFARCNPKAIHTLQKPTRTSIRNVPTWSWFTFSQTPTYPLIGSDVDVTSENIRILRLEVKWRKNPLTSPLRSVTLVVEGQLQVLEFKPHTVVGEWDGNTWALPGSQYIAFCYFDEPRQLPPGRTSILAPCLLLCACEDKDFLSEEMRSVVGDKKLVAVLNFLILRDVTGKSNGRSKYERIGIGQFDTLSKTPDPFKGVKPRVIELV